MEAPVTAAFTSARARSAAVTGALVMLIVVETSALHFLVHPVAPVLGFVLTALSVCALWWIVADYRAMGRVAARIDATTLHLAVGRRLRASIPRSALAASFTPTWSDLGAAAPPHLNATKPATPNVLLVFATPQPVLILGVVRKPIKRLSLHLDEPAAFLAALAAPGAPTTPTAPAAAVVPPA
jgi:hypothetical protein